MSHHMVGSPTTSPTMTHRSDPAGPSPRPAFPPASRASSPDAPPRINSTISPPCGLLARATLGTYVCAECGAVRPDVLQEYGYRLRRNPTTGESVDVKLCNACRNGERPDLHLGLLQEGFLFGVVLEQRAVNDGPQLETQHADLELPLDDPTLVNVERGARPRYPVGDHRDIERQRPEMQEAVVLEPMRVNRRAVRTFGENDLHLDPTLHDDGVVVGLPAEVDEPSFAELAPDRGQYIVGVRAEHERQSFVFDRAGADLRPPHNQRVRIVCGVPVDRVVKEGVNHG